jgi:sec-independent protein translocase protein TatC
MAKLPAAVQGARIVGERFVQSQRQQNPEGRMPLMDHIRELRNRVVKMALALAAGMAVGFVFFHWAFHIIERPLCAAVVSGQTGCKTLGVDKLVLDGPLDPFYLRVKVAFIVGIILSSPVWLYQIWAFIAPGLYQHEKKLVIPLVGSSYTLFLCGMSFAYFVVFPTIFRVMAHYNAPLGAQMTTDIDNYLSFVLTMFLAFGVTFEVPIVVVILARMGLVTIKKLKQIRPYVIVGAFVISAVVTPPDVFSQLILAVPLIILYEVGIIAARLIVGKDKIKEQEADAAEDAKREAD